MNNLELLELLDFGSVDSETEKNLDNKIVKTSYFEEMAKPNTSIIIGAKGSGKSALFQMFSKYESEAKVLAGPLSTDAIIVTGTGFGDIKELTTDDFQKLMRDPNVNFDQIWQLYIGIKVALKLGELGYTWMGDNLKEFLKQAGKLSDFRILPLLKSLWQLLFGTPPQGLDINILGASFKIGKKNQVDIQDVLYEADCLLKEENKTCWVLFDKIDELFSDNYNLRKQCIESLFRTYLQFINKFPQIKLKIFLRTDIWNTLEFVNKSHFVGKYIEIQWDRNKLSELMVRRACHNNEIRSYICSTLNIGQDTIFAQQNIEDSFFTIFSREINPGSKKAETLSWIIRRITDGLGGKYPREFITLGNLSKNIQKDLPRSTSETLITGKAISQAFPEVSKIKCNTYLAEFPWLHDHFERFRGQKTATYKTEDLIRLMRGLSPSGDKMIKQLHQVGILKPTKKSINIADEFTIPMLFRSGLGLSLRGRK